MKMRNLAITAAAAAVLLGTAGAQASAGTGTAAEVPLAVRVPAGNVLVGAFLARGVQVYQCTAGSWTFTEPAANLAGWVKRPGSVGTAVHFRGPTWESTDDGSLVEAKAVGSSPVPGSIPQLLLQATRTRGDGVFGAVSYIQRLSTRGGAAPTGTCTDGTTTGVPYTADYRFYQPAA